ncbi:LuxR C-terminal-related transcriptional regulator [Pigmentiphaga sp. GD03639]|uniref:LuxR C-terminal-related transcriptional regulator n=1 Tax=unclassified Pigmentiphaga TaxID=2626614 RepID=UPI000B41670A|nr:MULTISPECIES: LuxR C-terminal-related transcriptional regulator [unclassified Pigmentiphaga]MDH2239461.1 LuxR C-terminal-related transcriptional regulator [Pigmentiphaga sp. GD03639]OVZ60472.1 hypothetical protein CDO46_21690 [Pigmentiphaga sp. NML030171]
MEGRTNTQFIPRGVADMMSLAALASLFSPVPTCLTTRRSVLWCNDRFAELLDYELPEISGQSLRSFYDNESEYDARGRQGIVAFAASPHCETIVHWRTRTGSALLIKAFGRSLDAKDPFAKMVWALYPAQQDTSMGGLPRRQKEVLALLRKGLTSKEIARTLQISPRTVEKHRAQLLERAGVANTAALISRFA